ncbi:DUF721 domain-containing protein [bacterium]|nr:DUF721 domain-containing protein [bacterium]
MEQDNKPDAVTAVRRRFKPTSVERCAAPLISKAMGKRPALGWQLKRDWHQIVGESLSRCCYPSRLRGTQANPSETLVLLVLPAWAAEIQHHSEVILEKIAVYAGYRAIQRLHLQHTHTIPNPLKKHAELIPPPAAELPAPIAAQVGDIEHEALKSRLLSLARYVYAPPPQPNKPNNKNRP